MNDPTHSAEPENGAPSKLDRLDELLSLFFDDCLSEKETEELNRLLEDADARSRSFDTAQLHADLYSFFNEDKEESKPAIPSLSLPVSGFDMTTHS